MSGFDKSGRGTVVVDSRDVFDPNAKTIIAFSGRIVGMFERMGPNTWDPYRLVPQDGPVVDVAAGLKIQVEEQGARFRMRARGSVRVVEWIPTEIGGGESKDGLRARFLTTCARPFQNKAGIGVAAFIAKTVNSDGDADTD